MLRTLLKLAKVMAVQTEVMPLEVQDLVMLLVDPVVLLGHAIKLPTLETLDKVLTNILLNAHAYSATSQD